MRLAAVATVVLAALAVGCGDSGAGGDARPGTRLTITVWPQGRDAGGAKRWTLACAPVGGTLPTRTRACRQLAATRRPLAPVPADAVCTQVYGGPQEAAVTGRLRGERVAARFDRRDGCGIARWDRVSGLFPVATGTDR